MLGLRGRWNGELCQSHEGGCSDERLQLLQGLNVLGQSSDWTASQWSGWRSVPVSQVLGMINCIALSSPQVSSQHTMSPDCKNKASRSDLLRELSLSSTIDIA